MTVKHHVYAIQEGDDGPIKLGVAINVEKRLESLQTGNPRVLVVRLVLGPMTKHVAYDLEGHAHRRFASYRVLGEWFDRKVLEILLNPQDYARPKPPRSHARQNGWQTESVAL